MTGRDLDMVRLMGEPRTCLVRETGTAEGLFDVLSPAVGSYDLAPVVGAFVKPGSFAGYLTVMRRYFHLLVPEGHHGIVTAVRVATRKQRVEYGEPLFTVSPETQSFAGVAGETAGSGPARTDDVPDGMFGVKSPTDGIFYRRANPQSPAYVEEGALVTQGNVLALVEVMKCFNPIVYPGEPEFPPRARVKRVVPKDATEVKHGAILVVVEPA